MEMYWLLLKKLKSTVRMENNDEVVVNFA